MQLPFCTNFLRRLHQLDIHTALDTNGFFGDRLSDEDLRSIDLVILDIKSFDVQTHLRVTGQHNRNVLDFARRLRLLARPTWVRFVLVPGLTDQPENVTGLARFCGELPNVERVEVIPFHQLGRSRWHELGLDYSLEHTSPPSDELLQSVRDTFRRHGSICPD